MIKYTEFINLHEVFRKSSAHCLEFTGNIVFRHNWILSTETKGEIEQMKSNAYSKIKTQICPLIQSSFLSFLWHWRGIGVVIHILLKVLCFKILTLCIRFADAFYSYSCMHISVTQCYNFVSAELSAITYKLVFVKIPLCGQFFIGNLLGVWGFSEHKFRLLMMIMLNRWIFT